MKNNFGQKSPKTDTVPRWMAPETFRTMNYSMKSDIWSYGVTLWELYTPIDGQPYFHLHPKEIRQYILMNEHWKFDPNENYSYSEILGSKDIQTTVGTSDDKIPLDIPATCPAVIRSIMRKCWQFEPSKRCTFDDIVSILKDRIQHQESTPQNLRSEPSELIVDTSDIESETEPMISFHKLQGADQSSHKGVGQKC